MLTTIFYLATYIILTHIKLITQKDWKLLLNHKSCNNFYSNAGKHVRGIGLTTRITSWYKIIKNKLSCLTNNSSNVYYLFIKKKLIHQTKILIYIIHLTQYQINGLQ